MRISSCNLPPSDANCVVGTAVIQRGSQPRNEQNGCTLHRLGAGACIGGSSKQAHRVRGDGHNLGYPKIVTTEQLYPLLTRSRCADRDSHDTCRTHEMASPKPPRRFPNSPPPITLSTPNEQRGSLGGPKARKSRVHV